MARLAQAADPFWREKSPEVSSKKIPVSFKKGQVAVFMEMHSNESHNTYSKIKAGCNTVNLEAVRVDEKSGAEIIMKDIDKMIGNAEFLIFDLTEERQNVYYELGYAHGIGNGAYNILLVGKEGTKIHFDISPLRIHFYHSPDHLQSLIATQLKSLQIKKLNETFLVPKKSYWWKFW